MFKRAAEELWGARNARSVLKLRGKTRAESLAVRGHERTSLFIKRAADRVCEIGFDIQPQAQRQFGGNSPNYQYANRLVWHCAYGYERSVSRAGISPARISKDRVLWPLPHSQRPILIVLKSRLCVRGSSLFLIPLLDPLDGCSYTMPLDAPG